MPDPTAPDNRLRTSGRGTQAQAGGDRGVSQQDGAHIHLCHARFHHLHELIHDRVHLRSRGQSNQQNRLVFPVNEVSSKSRFIPSARKLFAFLSETFGVFHSFPDLDESTPVKSWI
jgi:hypothetical protein